jgi:hypothetical protein
MKTNPRRSRAQRGSALLTVIMLVSILAVLSTSMLHYTLSERRGNERNRLVLRSKTMAENISTYAAEQITTKLYRLRSASTIAFMTGANEVKLPPLSILQTADANFVEDGPEMEVRAGLTTATGLVYIDPATNPGNSNAGLQVNTANVPIISKATSRHSALGTFTSYSQQDLAVDFVPLFQFAVFYNMDMEVWPGANMTLAGPVHANGELSARSAQGFTATINFLDRVSTAKGFYANANRQGPWYQASGAVQTGAGGDAPVNFRHSTTAAPTPIKSGAGVWRDHLYGGASETTTTQNNFKVFATTSYGVNLRTSVHGVTDLVLPSVSNYAEADDPATTDQDERDNGRQVIMRPDIADTAGLKETKISRRAGLYIVVNPDDETRDGYLPDGTPVTMRARSYRCWLNTVNADQTHTLTEVILPGQPSYGPLNANVNNLPNAYRTDTAIGHNQVLRTIQGAGVDLANTGYNRDSDAGTAGEQTPVMALFGDAYFYDLRRARNNAGAASQSNSGTFRSGNAYTPRPIVKIDLDMTRFRMMVERTVAATTLSFASTDASSTIYDPGQPTSTNWARSIYNPGATAAAHGLGLGATTYSTLPTATTLTATDPYRMYFAPADPTDTLITTNPGAFGVGGDALVSNSTPRPWFDGITVYIHSVDAELRGDGVDAGTDPDRIDSGVRLWHGRGNVVSLNGTDYPSKTGFTLCTNDAAYIIGHFNADGTIESDSADNTDPGGYSARYADNTSERLCSVMADAVTLLSQPTYTNGTTPYSQNGGWSDSLSANRGTTSWSSSWQTTQPSGTNGADGINRSFVPAALPFLGSTVAGTSGSARTEKFGATTTEISTALLVGIVPTNHDPTGLTDGPPSAGANGQASGGVHNFPRLLEIWGSAGLYIRGSMVAMYESRVAMESWSLRIYSAPARTWGLHQGFRSANHDLPLEPILLGARRLGYKEINAADYATMKATIEALPH